MLSNATRQASQDLHLPFDSAALLTFGPVSVPDQSRWATKSMFPSRLMVFSLLRLSGGAFDQSDAGSNLRRNFASCAWKKQCGRSWNGRFKLELWNAQGRWPTWDTAGARAVREPRLCIWPLVPEKGLPHPYDQHVGIRAL